MRSTRGRGEKSEWEEEEEERGITCAFALYISAARVQLEEEREREIYPRFISAHAARAQLRNSLSERAHISMAMNLSRVPRACPPFSTRARVLRIFAQEERERPLPDFA